MHETVYESARWVGWNQFQQPVGYGLKTLQQQPGLKRESTKAPVEILVIDQVEKPSEN